MSRNQRRNRRGKPRSSQTANRSANSGTTEELAAEVVHRRSSTETKRSLRTTELLAYAGAVLAVVMTALALDDDGRGGDDPFGAETAIRYVTYLTIGYLLARGFAKSGSHENRIEHDADTDDDAAPTGVVHDDDARDDEDGDEPGDADDVDPAVTPPDRARPATTEDAVARP